MVSRQVTKSADFMSDNIRGHFSDSVACGVVDSVKDLHAPRQALRTGATQPFVAETIETEIPKFKTAAIILALAIRIKFRMKFVKQVSVLLRHRMGLQQIRTNGDDATLSQNDAAMPLGAVDVKADFLCQLVDVARAVDVIHAISA